MKISEVISLLKAGYSKKEIEELRASENVVTPAIEDASAKEEAPQPAEQTAAAAPSVPDNTEVLQAIRDLTKTLQMQNIRNSEMPVKQESTVDILGSLISGQKQ
ncbi:hypothetical protein [Ruminococcus sp.]|uniref:hypothetical protein n=1 Tax=Ruminococcus sp. TaxID=41978 RepID=UPI001B6E4693|nr:hypothetical protein [Ruminococcus sp.]MBP5433239.1 hypothetical protein [Ruminococcus sp.]